MRAISLKPNEFSLKRNVLGSSAEGNVYGLYIHKYLAVHVPTFGDLDTEDALKRFLEGEPDPDTRLHIAMQHVVASHELRHFHDCFGTSSGALLFLTHMARLRSFVDVCKRLSDDGLVLRLPLNAWAQEPDCPSYVTSFYRRLRTDIYRQGIFEGAFHIAPQITVDECVWQDFIAPPRVRIPAFPLHIAWGILEDKVPGIGRSGIRVHWVPIGFDTLVEGNAQALQAKVLRSMWPKDIIAEFEAAQTQGITYFDDEDELDLNETTGVLAQPYRITDLLLSKHLRANGINEFPLEWLLHLTDCALMDGYMPSFAEAGEISPPGGLFVALMDRTVWPKATSEALKLPTLSAEKLQSVRSTIADCAMPEKITNYHSAYGVLDYISSYVRHKIIAPLFDFRIKYGGEIFYDLEKYMTHVLEFPNPPMLIVGGDYRAHGDTDPEFAAWWSRYVMLSEIAEQVWSGRRIICCPRAYPSFDGLTSFHFVDPPGCDAAIAQMRCGTWYENRSHPLPQCYFEFITRMLFGSVT